MAPLQLVRCMCTLFNRQRRAGPRLHWPLPRATQGASDPPAEPRSLRITTPPFITNFTRSISVTSASGLPETAMMSANLPFSMRADLVLPIVVEHAGGRQIGRLQCLRRGHAPFDVIGELVGLLAVRDCGRGGAAAEHDRDAGRDRPPERLLHAASGANCGRRCRLQIAGFERDQVVERRHVGKLLLQQHLDARLVEFEQMIGRIDAGIDATVHALAAIGVAGDLEAEPVRLVDDRLDLLEASATGC